MTRTIRFVTTSAFVASVLAVSSAVADEATTTQAAAGGALRVEPASITLRHRREPHSVLVSVTTSDGYTVDRTDAAAITTENPAVAVVESGGWVRPVASGETAVTVALDGQSVRVPVRVALPEAERPYSFRHEVMPVLSKAGCNMGACHGYSLGKNGFKLSLRGSDPDLDYTAIKHDSLGRRLARLFPERSLLLTKPLLDVPHQGGRRIERGSLEYEILRGWIAQGAPGDIDDAKNPRRVVRVRTVPEKLTLGRGGRHRLQLIAEYDDGTTRDVTRLGIFSANNEQFATVNDDGLVQAEEFGETAVVARYARKFAATSVIVLRPAPDFTPTPVPDHVIDRHVVAKLNDLKITPSPVAGDEEFLRRVYLDLIGVQPTPDEVRTFLADPSADKRARVVDALFERPEFVDHWSLKWGDLLQNSRSAISQPSVYAFREWIRSAVAANRPLDEMVRDLLTARGGFPDDPASAYFAISKDTNDTLERVTQVFCGVRMLCARCHPHPLENWTQADYYGLASFFNQVSVKQDPRFPRDRNTRLVAVNTAAGFATNPRTGRPQPPRFLGEGEPELPSDTDRRVAYAQWLTSPENPHFARSMANRVWSYFFHRGIVEPVDDLRSTNPPVNPPLLDALTAEFAGHGFNLRHLMRTIVLSETYQRTCVANDSNRFDEQNFSHAVPRRIPAEALLDTLVQATGVPERFGGAPGGFRAAQLPDAQITSDFLELFGKPQRMEACECERDNESNTRQALHFINGETVLGRLANPNSRIAQLVRGKPGDPELIEELYLWTLARRPTGEERAVAADHFAAYGAKRLEAAQDLAWALLNSRDFLLVH